MVTGGCQQIKIYCNSEHLETEYGFKDLSVITNYNGYVKTGWCPLLGRESLATVGDPEEKLHDWLLSDLWLPKVQQQ